MPSSATSTTTRPFVRRTATAPELGTLLLLGAGPLALAVIGASIWLVGFTMKPAGVAFALVWLELVARLGFLRRNDNWSKLFDRFLDDRDERGVWHPHKGMAMPRSSNPFVWPGFPLEQMTSGDERWTDVTFRLGLIARLSGRPLELI